MLGGGNDLGSDDAHLAVLAMRGIVIEKVEPPPCPEGCQYILNWFFELIRQRRPSFSGISTIPYSEIKAWSSLKGLDLSRLELRFIIMLDNAFCEIAQRIHKAKTKTKAGD